MSSDYDNFSRLETGHLEPDTTCLHPQSIPEDVVTVDDPATAVFTDFKARRPFLAHRDTQTQEARDIMHHGGVKSLFVTNRDNHIVGQVALRDLEGIKKTQAAQENGVHPNEVSIGMVMTPFDQLPTLNFRYIESNRVGHIARLLHDLGVNYIIVVEDTDTGQIIRGIFSITRVSRMLGIPVTSDLSSHSLSDINKRLD